MCSISQIQISKGKNLATGTLQKLYRQYEKKKKKLITLTNTEPKPLLNVVP